MMEKVFELLELLGWNIIKESWYDEEGVEGTRLTSPEGKEYTIFGWDSDCDINEIIEAIRKSC